MIYIKNNTEIQTIFIPRSELQKEAYIASTKTYEDGYNDGFGKGKQYQKDQLLNLYVTENGEYEREDGWGVVTVDMSVPDCSGAYDEGYNQGYEDGQNSVECPEGGSCNLGEGEIYLTANDAGFYELYAADDGYDGWSKFYVTLENGGAIKIHKASDLLDIFNNGEQIDYGAYYYVGGKITDIQEVSMEWGNATYTLDNGFKVYRGKWIDGNHFSSEDQIKVGAYIAVYGIIQDYKGTLQFKAHSQVIAYQECEGGDLNIDAVSTSLGAGNWTKWTRNAAEYGLDGMSEITIDGSQYQEWTKAHTLLQAYYNTEEAYITENGEYRPNIGYDGFALKGYNVAWVIDVVPTIDTDVEIWVKPYDGAPNIWQGYIGSQASDDDNTTFQIRKMDGSNTFSFRFGNMEFEYGFEYERWYRLRMNRNGIWVNGEQVCGWDVQVFEENPNPLMINGIYNLGFESENYRMNNATYGYVYFHNTDSLLIPSKNGLFIGNKNQTIGRPATEDAILQYERNWYPKGYTKVTVDVPQNGGSGDCNIQNQKRVDLNNTWEVFYPDEGYDGVYEFVVDANAKAEEWREEGKNDIREKLKSIDITENGRYSVDDSELVNYIEFDGNSYFDTNIPFGENTKIEVAITKTTYEEEEQFIGTANFDLFVAETYGGFGIVAGAGLAYGVFGRAKTHNIPFSYEEEQILTLDRNGLNSSLYDTRGWIDESGLVDDTVYGHTIGIGKINSSGDGWIYRGLNGRIRYVKIWTDGNDDSTLVTFIPKNMAQGGFSLVNSDGIEYDNISNLGEGTTTFISEWVRKYGEGWKEINVNVDTQESYNQGYQDGYNQGQNDCPSVQEQITDYTYNQLTLYSYRNIGFNDFEGCFYDSNNEPITDVLVVRKKVDFEYSFKFFTKVPIKTCSKIPYPNNPLYGLTRLYFNSIPSVNLNYKDNDVLSLYIEDVDYLNMDGATLNGLLRIWLKGTTTFSQGLEIGTAQIKDSGTVYSDGTNTDKLSSFFSTWTIINDHKLP